MKVEDEKGRDDKAIVPADFLRVPVFQAEPNSQEVVFIDDRGEWRWRTGIRDPLAVAAGLDVPPIVTGLTVEHAAVLFGLMSFSGVDLAMGMKNPDRHLQFSLRELAVAIYGSYSGQYYRKVARLLYEMRSCWGSLQSPDGGVKYFQIIHAVNVGIPPPGRKMRRMNPNQPELWLDGVEISESYLDLLSNSLRTMCVDISLFREIGSSLAKTLYMFIPSRAAMSTEDKPFKIYLKLLFDQIGYDGKCKYKSQRYQTMMQGKKSVLQQLDGARILGGKIMRCELIEKDDDYILSVWHEKNNHIEVWSPNNKTEAFIKEVGFSRKEYAGIVGDAQDVQIEYDYKKWGRGIEWQLKIYAVILGVRTVLDIMANERDGRAGPGALVEKLRAATRKSKGL